MIVAENGMPENIAVFGNCNFYSLLKVLVTRCCNVAFGSVACIIRCWFLVNHLAVQAMKLVFWEARVCEVLGNTTFSEP